MRIRFIPPAALLFVMCLVAAAPAAEAPVKVHRKTTEPRTVALIRHKGPYSEIPKVTKRLYAELDKGGYIVCGPLMAVFYNDPGQTAPEELQWDVRIPVTNPGSMLAVDDDELGFGYQTPAYVAYTYHVGPYETIKEAYTLLFDWARTNSYEVNGYPSEIYWSPPDAKNPVTEIWLPVKEKTPAERAFR